MTVLMSPSLGPMTDLVPYPPEEVVQFSFTLPPGPPGGSETSFRVSGEGARGKAKSNTWAPSPTASAVDPPRGRVKEIVVYKRLINCTTSRGRVMEIVVYRRLTGGTTSTAGECGRMAFASVGWARSSCRYRSYTAS